MVFALSRSSAAAGRGSSLATDTSSGASTASPRRSRRPSARRRPCSMARSSHSAPTAGRTSTRCSSDERRRGCTSTLRRPRVRRRRRAPLAAPRAQTAAAGNRAAPAIEPSPLRRSRRLLGRRALPGSVRPGPRRRGCEARRQRLPAGGRPIALAQDQESRVLSRPRSLGSVARSRAVAIVSATRSSTSTGDSARRRGRRSATSSATTASTRPASSTTRSGRRWIARSARRPRAPARARRPFHAAVTNRSPRVRDGEVELQASGAR